MKVQKSVAITYHYGKVIKKFRELRSLSQFELETKAKLSYGSLSRIENGFINPTKETLFKIATVLKLSKDEIMEMFGI